MVVDEFIVEYCEDLVSVVLTVQNGGKGNETLKSRHLSVNYCESLESIDIDRCDLISGGLETLTATGNAVYDDEMTKTGGLSSVDIEALPQLYSVDIHDNYLGTGFVKIGDFLYSNGSFSNLVNGNTMQWMGYGNSLTTLIAYGNEINWHFWSQGECSGNDLQIREGYVQIGTIPEGKEDLVMGHFTLGVGFNRPNKKYYDIQYWFGDLHNQNRRSSDGIFDRNRDGRTNHKRTYAELTSSGTVTNGTVVRAKYQLIGNDTDYKSHMYIYPFGQ